MTARTETYALIAQLATRGISISFEDANTLRRAQLTLHRWCELECGDGNNYGSWAIERDDVTNLPYMCQYPHDGGMGRYRIADREAGALRRVTAICKRIGAYYHYQTDPRGCALYVSNEPLPDHNYSHGIACCA